MTAVRLFKETDFQQVKDIYQQGIDTGHATFQEKAKSWLEWDQSTLEACRLVAVEGNTILGWAALSPVSTRPVYAGVAEVSVYVSSAARGLGVGQKLLSSLILESENSGIWTLQAGIFPENIASMALHKKNGFKQLGVREKLGQMHGVWRDVTLWERRSQVVGC